MSQSASYFPGFPRRVENLSLPAILGRGVRIYIVPTRHGLVFVLFLLAMLLGSINYGNNLGFLLTFLLGSIGFVSLFSTHGVLKNLRLETAQAQPVFAGEQAQINLTFSAPDQNHLGLQCAFDIAHPVIIDILSNQSGIVKIQVPTQKRGKLFPWPLRISSEYPLGLFRSWVWVYCPMEILVYPAPSFDEFPLVQSDSAESESSQIIVRQGVEDFKGLRGYQRGDLLQRIAWKASFRGQGLMVKEFQGNAGEALWLDFAEIPISNLETKLSILCGMVLNASNNQRMYGLRLPNFEIAPALGDEHKHDCLAALALYTEPPKESSRGNA